MCAENVFSNCILFCVTVRGGMSLYTTKRSETKNPFGFKLTFIVGATSKCLKFESLLTAICRLPYEVYG